MAIVGGYTVFLPGFWEVQTFLFSYFMVFLFPVLFVGWKVVKRTRWYAPEEVDLKGEREEIEEVCFFFSFFPSFLFLFLFFPFRFSFSFLLPSFLSLLFFLSPLSCPLECMKNVMLTSFFFSRDTVYSQLHPTTIQELGR